MGEHARTRLINILDRCNAPPPLEQMLVPPPPNVIPDGMLADFTLNGKIKVLYWYFDEQNIGLAPLHNTPENYEKIFRSLNAGRFDYYLLEGRTFFDALKKYPLHGESIVWGLAGCNCEALAIWAGAEKVFVVEYNKPVCEHEKITVFSHEELSAVKVKSDFAFSYSSFEHDGLGRYGEPLRPAGDLLAMRQAWSHLKDNGILFLGVPLGQDCLVWNAHRIYGRYRLPALLRGWRLLDVYNAWPESSPEFPFDLPLGEHRRQFLLVLRKIAVDFPDDEYLLRKIEIAPDTTTYAPAIYYRINRLIYDYKQMRW
jgi:hypothetical protein